MHAAIEHTVADADTAIAMGSGDVPVLGTPKLVALAEAATVAAVELDEGRTSVGTMVRVEHLRASRVGATVRVRAELVESDGRTLRFAIDATQDGTTIGRGEVVRVVVDRERFLAQTPVVERG